MPETSIPYATKTLNPLVGCPGPLASRGCERCWARALHDKRHRAKLAGKGLPEMYREPFDKLQWFPERLSEPLRWRKPQVVFCGSQTDLFNDAVPDDALEEVFSVMALAPQHLFLVLTKRPERMSTWLSDTDDRGRERWAVIEGRAQRRYSDGTGEDPGQWLAVHPPLRNVLLGATACTQSEVDRVAPILAQLAALGWRTWLSLEPLLEGVDLTPLTCPCCGGHMASCEPGAQPWCIECDSEMGSPGWLDGIEWVVAGCEAGPKHRPCTREWLSGIARQCSEAGVSFFCKQVEISGKVSKAIEEWPSELQRQERPHAR